MHKVHTSNYYDHSTSFAAGIGRRALAALAFVALVTLGCGASNTQVAKSARRVAIAHLSELPEAERPKALASLPVILEVRKGDRFPLEVLVDSRLLTLHTEGTWTVEARETFHVLLREEGPPAVSEDGVDFDNAPRNSFGVGFNVQAGQPAKVLVSLGWYAGAAAAAP